MEGALADEARAAILDVARALANGVGEPLEPRDAVLFWAYVAGAFDDEWIAHGYDAAVGALCTAVGRTRSAGLFHGEAGTGFALAHVTAPGDADEALIAIDGFFDTVLDVDSWPHDYDLISGIVGIGVYLLERGDAPTARKALDHVVRHLIANAELTEGGVAWFTRPALLLPHQRTATPNGNFNLGVAHGIPGVIALLGRIAATVPDADPRCRRYGVEAMRWLASQRLIASTNGRYPANVERDGANRGPARTAWCYGDPGVAIAMWSAAARFGEPADAAIELARECTRRPLERCGVVDPSLCHGAGGLAHLFNRFYQRSGDVLFADAARAWIQRTLELRRAEGVGGFAYWWGDLGGTSEWRPNTTILEGAAGVALALLAAIEPCEPAWDRMLLCDLPLPT